MYNLTRSPTYRRALLSERLEQATVYPDLSTRHDWPVKKGLCFVCRDRLRLAERISYGVCTGCEQKQQKSEHGRKWPQLAKRSGKKPLSTVSIPAIVITYVEEPGVIKKVFNGNFCRSIRFVRVFVVYLSIERHLKK